MEQTDLEAAALSIERAESLALACHVSPDGDALGSMLALYHLLRDRSVPVVASFPEPFEVAPHYRDLPGLHELTAPSDFPAEPDVMITFDCGSLARLGELAHSAKSARELIVLDHHVSNDRYGTINVIDADAAATAVVVRALAERLALPLNRDAAFCLYTALVCDTGRFQYDTTTPAVFEFAAELAAFNLPIASLSRHLFEEHRFAYLQLVAHALAGAQLVAEKRFVWAAVRHADLERFGVSIDEAEGLIDIVRRTQEAEVSAVLKEEAGGRVRVSLRSLGAVDVRFVAEAEGGGGHRFAAGFTSNDPIEAIAARICAALPAA